MSRVDRLVKKLPPGNLTREEHEELARLLARIEAQAVVGAASSGSPTTPTVPQPPGTRGRYFRMTGETQDAPSWQGAGYFQYSDNGTTLVTQIDDAGYIFNEQGSDIDFKIEGDTDTTLFVLDAGSDVIGIGGAVDASYKLKVTGATAIDGDLTFIGAQQIVTSAGALTLNPATDVITADDVKLYSGADLIVYSDAGSTVKATVDGATGNFTTAGDLIVNGANIGITADLDLATLTANTFTIAGTLAATTVTGANVTTGADPGHTHTGGSIGSIDISDDTNLAVTAPIVLTDDTLSHSGADGYVHIPSGGSSAQILQYSSAGTAKWVTLSNDATIADGGAITIDHGNLDGLADDDHTQYILHSLADATNDFLVASGADTFVKKTLAETGAILETDLDHGSIQGLSDDDHTQYILHSLADAANDFLVASGADTFVKKTLAETGAILETDIDHGNIQGLDTGADHSYIDQDVTSTGTPSFATLDVNGHMGIGNLGSVIATAAVYLADNTATASGSLYGIYSVLQSAPAGASSSYLYGGMYISQIASGNAQTHDFLCGMRQQTLHYGTGTLLQARGIDAVIQNLSTATITYAYSVYVNPPVNSGGGAITINYGIWIGDQTVGGTNYAIYTGLGVNRFGDYMTIVQDSTTGAQPVLEVKQDDISEGFINYVGTSAASAAGPISSWTAGNSIQGFVRAEINGVQYWMPYYDDPTS